MSFDRPMVLTTAGKKLQTAFDVDGRDDFDKLGGTVTG
jgi:hypothetical protein